jgi:kynurenine formamidase
LGLALGACSDRTPTGVGRPDQSALDRAARPNAPIGTVVTGVQDGAAYSLGITVTQLALAPDGKTLLASGVVIVEGLNLGGVGAGEYELICLPLRIEGGAGDGAPARAILRTLE